MKILIVEDEYFAAKRLSDLVAKIKPGATVLNVLDSIEESVTWLKHNPMPDLIFMDIQLADGLSFSIFDHVEMEAPIIFTTAFDEYALKAFKVNSIDYLLKPVDEKDLEQAFNKYDKLNQRSYDVDWKSIADQLHQKQSSYQDRILIKKGNAYAYLKVDDINYFFSEDGLTFCMDKSGHKKMIDKTLDQLEGILDPSKFFRVNRKFIMGIDGIISAESYFNSRLSLKILNPIEDKLLVSRDRVKSFKEWLGS